MIRVVAERAMSNSFVQSGGREMNVPRIVRAVAILALLITTSAGFTLGSLTQPAAARGQGEGEPVQGGVLRLSLGEAPDQLDPARTIELTASQVMEAVCGRLVSID